MKQTPFHAALLVALVLGAPARAATAPDAVVFVPARPDAPLRRVGGSSRGVALALPFVAVLAPEQAGYTLEEQPVLYWFASAPSSVRLELTLIDEKGVAPMVEKTMDGVQSAGVHAFALRDASIRLKPGVDYQWSVALVPDPDQRSGDVLSQGVIQRLAPKDELAEQLKSASGVQRAALLARAGIWYDAIDALSSAIAADPGNVALRAQRAELLAQVGLKEVAAYERGEKK
jgi:hypothetical protein